MKQNDHRNAEIYPCILPCYGAAQEGNTLLSVMLLFERPGDLLTLSPLTSRIVTQSLVNIHSPASSAAVNIHDSISAGSSSSLISELITASDNFCTKFNPTYFPKNLILLGNILF